MDLILRTIDGTSGGPEEEAQEFRLVVRRTADGDAYEVRLGERTIVVDAPRVAGGGPGPLSGAGGGSVRSLLVEGRQHEIAVRPEKGRGETLSGVVVSGDYLVLRQGVVSRFEVTDPLTHLARQSGRGVAAQGGHRIHAYMPGRVISILVEVGAAITSGQSLVVLEAMKMQNEILAERPGTVRAVHVTAGQAVEGGDLLFEVE